MEMDNDSEKLANSVETIENNSMDNNSEILGNSVEPIENSYNKTEIFPSVVDRYYTKRYVLDVGHKFGDYCILFHSNRICVVTLAPSHPIRSMRKSIESLDFQISTSIDRLDNRVSGKSKRGAQRLDVNSALCFAKCADGEIHKICAGIPGKLVEINENLPENPSLLVECPETEGFVAIVLPSIPTSERFKAELMNYEQYLEAVAKREGSCGKEERKQGGIDEL
ncbi:protein Abitram [Nilaparvata lugens]|uniref:protein Abitram n=1 Tax=Nilaparvata lugens TaxID=108931 RepID=UPI00193E8F0B|nr:protein Abitram [Nilaparvata lugens]XP_039294825.1 protein Abitram [Nilaparvata lugens]